MVNVIEQHLQAKEAGRECEDGIFVGDHFVAVVDGATSRTGELLDGHLAGWWAKEAILAAIPAVPGDVSAPDFFDLMGEALLRMQDDLGLAKRLHNNPEERPSASMVVHSLAADEVWFVGDCQARVGKTLHRPTKAWDAVMTDARRAIVIANQRARAAGETPPVDEARFMLDLRRAQMWHQRDGGGPFDYQVLDGVARPKPWLVAPVASPQVVLASDGYPQVAATLAEAEAALAHVLKADPDCIAENPQPKGLRPGGSFDDRAYIRYEIQT